MTTICPWTGQPFEPIARGGNVKKFASNEVHP